MFDTFPLWPVRATAPIWSGLFGKWVRLEHGRTVTADENYIRESILAPGAESGQRIQANHMLVFQGLRMTSS